MTAAASALPFNAASVLEVYGPLGLMAAIGVWLTGLAVVGRLVPLRDYERVIAENVELRRQIPDVVVALQQSTDAVKESTKVQRDTLVLLEVRRRTPR